MMFSELLGMPFHEKEDHYKDFSSLFQTIHNERKYLIVPIKDNNIDFC